MDATAELTEWLIRLEAALAGPDPGAASALFGEECYWRDLVAFTWTIRTMEGRPAIAAMLAAQGAAAGPVTFRVAGAATRNGDAVEGWAAFTTARFRGRAHVRLRGGAGFTLLTAARALLGFEEREGPTRELGTPGADGRGWPERRAAARAAAERHPYVLVVGGGQAGLALGARLKRLEVPALIVDALPRPGDAWRRRYDSLCLHDPVWFDHMPYLPFPAHWPVFTPKDKMGDWLEMYARVMELDVWSSTTCMGAEYDEDAGRWTVRLDREGDAVTVRPAHLVLATGLSGMPNVPDVPGRESFGGQQHHSSAHRGGMDAAGMRAVVVGSNNSAHDIAADLVAGGAQVTMLQRSPTTVIRSEMMLRHAWGPLFSEEALARGIDTDTADLLAASMPYRLLPGVQRPIYAAIAEEDAAFYDRLRAVGFRLDFGEDGSGLSLKYLRRGSGYYIDVGASALVADGTIALRGGEIARVGPDGVTLANGERLPADLIVWATGYGDMSEWVARLVSPAAAAKVGPCWGMGSGTARDPGPWEGELRNMWRPTAQPGLWFQAGNLAQARHYSRYLSLQLKARFEGVPGDVFVG